MSRIGKLPVPLPAGVKLEMSGGRISVSGPKGKLEREIPNHVELSMESDRLVVNRTGDSNPARAAHGLTRTLVANMVTGVTAGFTKELEIVGVGYRAEQLGGFLLFNLGYSHPILFELPAGVDATVKQNVRVALSGIDKELIGQTAATIRSFRPPEPYKGKGIRYVGEQIRSKVGKSGV